MTRYIVIALIIAFVIRLVWFIWSENRSAKRSVYWKQAPTDIKQTMEMLKTIWSYWDRTMSWFDYALKRPHSILKGDGGQAIPEEGLFIEGTPPRELFVTRAVLMEFRARAKYFTPSEVDQGTHRAYLHLLDAMISLCETWSADQVTQVEKAHARLRDEISAGKDSGWSRVPRDSFRRTRLAVFFLGNP